MNRLAALLFAAALFVPLAVGPATVQENGDAWTLRDSYTVKVREVVDGDTVYIRYRNGIPDELRLIGVDTPETAKYRVSPEEFSYPDTDTGKRRLWRAGKAAEKWLKSRINTGDVVRIRLDTRSDTRGSYGRLLVYLIDGGTNINRELVRSGQARVYREGDFTKKQQFLRLERRAQQADRGLWSGSR